MTDQFDAGVSVHGINFKIANLFGKCDVQLPSDKIRNIAFKSVITIARDDDVTMVVKNAIHRGLALTQIAGSDRLKGSLVVKIRELAEQCLNQTDQDTLKNIVTADKRSVQEALSNDGNYKKVLDVCSKMRKKIEAGLRLEIEKSFGKKLGIGVLAIAGGFAVYLAGPCLLLVGYEVAAGALGFSGSGYAANRYLTEDLGSQIYETVVELIKSELYLAWSKRTNQKLEVINEVNDLITEGSLHSKEKAICLMYDKQLGVNNFNGCKLEACVQKSKEHLIHRIMCIKKVYEIRDLLATQCFIGVIGPQDAGKTTFLNSVWDVKGVAGYGPDKHTLVTTLYDISDKIKVVDFPGDTSLANHSKAFSICGAMNNIIIVIITYQGDVSKTVSQELANIYHTMQQSRDAKIIICINKCGLYSKKLREEFAPKGGIEYLRNHFTSELNRQYKGKYKLKQKDFFFTDWELQEQGEEEAKKARDFGIVEVEGIKEEIKKSLTDIGIMKEHDIDELNRAVSPKR